MPVPLSRHRVMLSDAQLIAELRRRAGWSSVAGSERFRLVLVQSAARLEAMSGIHDDDVARVDRLRLLDRQDLPRRRTGDK